LANFLLYNPAMMNWRRFTVVSDRWQLTVRLAAYIALALLLFGVGRRGIEAPTALPSATLPPILTPPEFSAEQRKIQAQLQSQLQSKRPTHRLTLSNGRIIDCQIVMRTEHSLRIRECLGFSGQIEESYPREKFKSLTPLPPEMFEVTLADVQLFEEFPTFKFAKFPPYTFVTDESFGTIEQILQQLLRLRRQFIEHFAPLIREPSLPRNIQVVFFARQDKFKEYAQAVEPLFVNSAGFYCVAQNRLAILNQFGSRRYNDLSEKIDSGLTEDTDAARKNLNRLAQAITQRSINHEGAHQLFYAYGIHSPSGAEPTWLKEGLAQYCEPSEVGAIHPELARRVAELHRTGKLIPLPELLTHHSATGFVGFPKERAEAAYAQSWALVYFLMQEPTQAKFFEFIKRYRDVETRDSAKQLRTADVPAGLTAALGVDFATLEFRWLAFVGDL
jgi:hypothetical protein